MKKLFIITALMALAVNGAAQEIHYDFSVINSTGYELFYRIVDEQNHWVEITYPCQNGDNYYWGYDKPEDKLILADTITHQGTDYYLIAIGDHAFCGCTGLRGALEFPETIQSIGAGAFKGCSNLNGSLVLPESIRRVEDETFSGCASFSGKLILPDSIQYVGNQAFLGCSGFSGMMMLPETLAFVGDEAFKGCSGINAISVKATALPTTSDDAFNDIPTWITVNVPYHMKEAYQSASGWSRFASHTVEKSVWTGNAEPWTYGSGTDDDPFLIESAENLAWLAKSVNKTRVRIDTIVDMAGFYYLQYSFNDVYVYQDTCFRLVIDIDLGKSNGSAWDPIGNCHFIDPDEYEAELWQIHSPHHQHFNNMDYNWYYTYFSGQFDGNGHVVSQAHYLTSFPYLQYSYESGYRIGFFGLLDHAVVQNLTFNNLEATPYYDYTTGGVAGSAFNSTISNCHLSGTIKGGTCGGIVGTAQKCRIEACSVRVDIKAMTAGGVVGVLENDSTNDFITGVFDCSFVGQTQQPSLTGGVVGICRGVSGESKGNIHIMNSFSRGKLYRVCPDPDHYTEHGKFVLGGIIGEVSNVDTLFILNCYNNDTIYTVKANNGDSQYYGGGILAYADANTTLVIKNCYHVGPITTQYKGGILVQNTNMTIVRNSFFDQAVAPDNGFGLPLESDYMKTEAFVSLLNNGSTVFKMDTEPYENGGYPVFGIDGLIFVGAEWYYEIQNDNGSVTYQHLEYAADTTIGTTRPKIIVRTNTIYDRDDFTETTHEYVYEENGVVYWWNKELQTFTVLYDFGAEVGDEWEIKVGTESITMHVDNVEYYEYEGRSYRMLHVSDPENLFSGDIVCGIGHLTSFFPEKLMNRGKGYRVENLRCFWVDGTMVFKMGDEDCDAVYEKYHHGIDDEPGESGLAVYPNPANDVLFVEMHGRASQPTPTYRITNLMGQTVIQGRITAETQEIDIVDLPVGMYFITIDGATQKFVINR